MALSESDICVAILNWNGLGHLKRFLPSVVANSGESRVRVIDNASADGSVHWLQENFPEVELHILEKNHGFTGGYNRGLEQIDSELIVLLNSDVEVPEGWLQPLLNCMNLHENVAACQPKILSITSPDLFEYAGASGGFLDMLGYPFCRGRIFDNCEKDLGQYEDNRRVFWASGACMLVRRKAFQAVGGLEEVFFAHMEEIDLCWRFWQRGWEVMVVPGSEVLHLGAGTLAKTNPRKTLLNFRNGLCMLYINTTGTKTYLLVILRLLLDGLAGAQFLIKGKWRNCLAIIQAHLAFYSGFAYWRKRRKENNQASCCKVPADVLYDNSIVWQYFIRGKKKFSDLRLKER